MSNLTINTSFGNSQQQQLQHSAAINQQQIKQLLEQQAAIQAQIISLSAGSLSASSPQQYHRSPIHKQSQHRRRDVPRSMSTSGATTMSRHISSDRADAAAISRSLSQRSAPAMARTNSRGSASQRSSGKIPFANSNGTVRPLNLPSDSRRDDTVVMDWTDREQPFSSYTPTHQAQPLQRSVSQRKPELPRVPEHGRILDDLPDPSDFISQQYGAQITPILSLSPPMSLPNTNDFVTHRSSSSLFDFQTPSTPSTAQLTHATTFDNTMSRSSSHLNDNFESMMRINSNNSYSEFSHVDHNYDQFTPTTSSPCHIRRSSSEEQKQLLAGAGGASHESQFSHPIPEHFQASGSLGAKMEKSDSNGSNSSSSSRSKLRLQIQIAMAESQKLAPKGGEENALSRSSSSQSMLRSDSKDGSQDKVAISKPTYQRPKHERVFCSQCDNHPEGFRGEHELRRHQDREHKKLVKKFICIEPTGEGRLKPILPLSKCKACGQAKKTYGAYYNAAAHLRRTHFNPKASKGRSKGLKDVEEKRGGKGGGDWPPMSELKNWMKEVEVTAQEYDSSQQGEAEASDDEVEATSEQAQPFSDINSDYQNAYFSDAPAFNSYQNDMYDIISLDTQSQYADPSMYYSSSQETFPSFSPQILQNDLSAFLPQDFRDPGSLTGPEFQNFSY